MGAAGITTAGRWRWRRSFNGFRPKISINYLTINQPNINHIAVINHCKNRSDAAHDVVVVGRFSACSQLPNHALFASETSWLAIISQANRIPPSFPKQSVHRLRFRGRARINLGTSGINSDNFQAFIITTWQSPWLNYL